MKRFKPCIKYFDEWDEEGSPSLRECKDGQWVPYENAKNMSRMYEKQIERLKNKIMKMQKAMED